VENLPEKLMEELQPHIAFTIPLLEGIAVPQSIAVTWLIMLILVIPSMAVTRHLKTVPTGAQNYAELVVGFINGFVKGTVGQEWRVFAPFLGTLALYLSLANTISIFGFKPPTKDLNVTTALSIMSITAVIAASIRFKGLKGWLKHFSEPLPFILPMNILELFIRPLSLCMRLFGNILGSFIIMELIYQVIPLALPAILSIYFDIFDGLIQMAVFVFLTTLYIKEAIE